MFRKQFHVKTNAQLKSSERKKLRELLQTCFPRADPAAFLAHFPNKGVEVTSAKIETYQQEQLEVYCTNKVPLFIKLDNDLQQLLPSVYALWRVSADLLHIFYVTPAVYPILSGGADVMLPGILVDVDGRDQSWGNLGENELCAVALRGNRAAVAVGQLLMSSETMRERRKYDQGGKAVRILHIYEDHLWRFGPKTKLPHLFPILEASDDGEEDEQLLEGMEAVGLLNGAVGEVEQKEDEVEASLLQNHPVPADPEVSPEDLFTTCFLCALKFRLKIDSKLEFPVLVSTFYAKYLLPEIAAVTSASGDQTKAVVVDIKKTRFKKLSAFLSLMQAEGVCSVGEAKKGVEVITGVNWNNPRFRGLQPTVADNGEAQNDALEKESRPLFSEVYSITAAVLPLLQRVNPRVQKGQSLVEPEIRKLITEYIKLNNLQQGQLVCLDDLLTKILPTVPGDNGRPPSKLPWAQVIQGCLSRCTLGYMVTSMSSYGDEPPKVEVKKGQKIPKVEIRIERRAANKKVTLVSNLEAHLIDVETFAKTMQHRRSVAAGVTEARLVQIQGDQSELVEKLLIEEHKLPKRFIVNNAK